MVDWYLTLNIFKMINQEALIAGATKATGFIESIMQYCVIKIGTDILHAKTPPPTEMMY